jgi:hypothetical protein
MMFVAKYYTSVMLLNNGSDVASLNNVELQLSDKMSANDVSVQLLHKFQVNVSSWC